MNKILSKLAIVMIFSFSCGTVLAVDSPGWIGPTKILKISIQPNGNAYITLSSLTLDLGCPGGDSGKTNGLLQLDTNAPLFKEQYALLLSAQARKADIKIYANNCGYYPYAQNTNVCTSDGCF